jgi:hypothetical protein
MSEHLPLVLKLDNDSTRVWLNSPDCQPVELSSSRLPLFKASSLSIFPPHSSHRR